MAKTATSTKTPATRKTAAKPTMTASAQAVLQDIEKRRAAKQGTNTEAPAPAPAAQGEGASATPPSAPHIDLKRYIDALTQAQGFSKASIDLEMAVSLSIFAEAGEANINSKREVMKAYNGAGWKCVTPAEADYKTVSRRLNAAAALFDKMGGKAAIDSVTAGVPEEAHIAAIVNHLATNFELTSLNAVWAAAGRPVKNVHDWNFNERTKGAAAPETPQVTGEGASAAGPAQLPATPAPTPQAAPVSAPVAGAQTTDNATVLTAGMLTLVIPNNCPYDDVANMMAELMAYIETMKDVPGQEPVTAEAAAPAPTKRASTKMH